MFIEKMIINLEKQCGDVHIPTLLLCGGCLLPSSPHLFGMTELLREKIAIGGIFILFLYCFHSTILGKSLEMEQDKVLKTFVLMGIIEIAVSIMQLIGVYPSFHQFFKFTGTFSNPSVFALIISLCLPICLFYFMHTACNERRKWLFLSFLLFIWIVFAESRTSIIAVICSSLFIFIMERPSLLKLLLKKRILFSTISAFVIALGILYYCKRDSADGRVLIWSVSMKMIAAKPWLGWGENGFEASYMQYQALFLNTQEKANMSYLADNVTHPFNEFLLVAIKYGIFGSMLLFVFLLWFIKIILINKGRYRNVYLSILITLFIHSMFSYPYSTPLIWIVSSYLFCNIMSTYSKYILKRRVLLLLSMVVGILGILYQNKNIQSEWKWYKLQMSMAPVSKINHEYKKLYVHLKNNPSFMYNYGAWLHHNNFFDESLEIMMECAGILDDYNVELLIADNYKQLGKIDKSIERFKYAHTMIPSRFIPLYYIMILYESIGDYDNACMVAQIIIDKPMKIKKSPSVIKIKKEARKLLYRQQ